MGLENWYESQYVAKRFEKNHKLELFFSYKIAPVGLELTIYQTIIDNYIKLEESYQKGKSYNYFDALSICNYYMIFANDFMSYKKEQQDEEYLNLFCIGNGDNLNISILNFKEFEKDFWKKRNNCEKEFEFIFDSTIVIVKWMLGAYRYKTN